MLKIPAGLAVTDQDRPLIESQNSVGIKNRFANMGLDTF